MRLDICLVSGNRIGVVKRDGCRLDQKPFSMVPQMKQGRDMDDLHKGLSVGVLQGA